MDLLRRTTEVNQSPYCTICKKVFSNSSMNSFTLKRHLDSQHENYKDKDVLFFENNNKEEVSVTNIYVSASYHLIFIMISEEASKEFESIPLLAKIVKRRI
jgi:hypothetical protein